MEKFQIRSEDRGGDINFTGTGFMFVRHYEACSGGYPFEVDLHRHEWHEFVWARCPGASGGAANEFILDGERFAFADSTLIYVPPFHAHRFLVNGPLLNWIIGIDHFQACKLFENSPLARPLAELFESWKRLPSIMSADSQMTPDFEGFVRELASPARAQGSPSCLDALHLLQSLNKGISSWEGSAGGTGDKDSGGADSAHIAKEFLEKNFAESIGVVDCAKYIGVSRSTLSHQFRAATGRSVPQYLSEIRLRNARAMLEETDIDIIAIAMECGFNNSNWFSRQFKTAYGQSPSAWRSRAKALHKK
jgi:AraC-type DNA-binding domain-containing proteins